jgi:hypothetical protein
MNRINRAPFGGAFLFGIKADAEEQRKMEAIGAIEAIKQ